MKILKKTLFCSRRSGRDYDKFEEAGSTPPPAKKVKPLITKECVTHLECKLHSQIATGDYTMFVGEIVEAHVDKEVFTVNSEKSTNYILERFRITDFFGTVVPRNSVKYVKPNSEHFEAALKALGVDPYEAVVVGDGVSDMKCAKELRAIAVGLPTGFSSRKE